MHTDICFPSVSVRHVDEYMLMPYETELLHLFFCTVAVFSGHSNSSFYVKSSVSPDDQFLASGSSDHQAYIWKVMNNLEN